MNNTKENNKFDWKKHILNIPNYPKPGVEFKDITPLIGHGKAFKSVIDDLAQICTEHNLPVENLVCPEARGFMFGSALAYKLGVGFLPVRKPGKLPRKTCSVKYDLEYGTDELQMHLDDIKPGQKIILVDDVLATGGTMVACIDLLEKHGADVVAALFVIELSFLNGREKLEKVSNLQIHSLVSY